MSLVRTIVTNIGLTLLSWVSILFVFAAGNILVVFFALEGVDFGWVIVLELVLNIMSGVFVVGLWFREAEATWDFIALLVGFVLACVCLAALMFTTGENSYLGHFYRNYEVHQAKMILSVPALTVFGCFLYFWKNELKLSDRTV